ncbi:MAG: lipid-A-disaccharide synthase [Verrucomicrobiota bacterium]
MGNLSKVPEIHSFAPPENGRCDLLVVAGEHSGDQHAATAVRDLLGAFPEFSVSALGGPALKGAGAQVLYELTELSVVGFVEVLSHYGEFKHLFAETINWIETHKPNVVCLVDYPGFNLRLARELKKRGVSRKGGGEVTVLFYISPQIWAWKAKRRFSMQECLDELGTIFPFEVECYKDTTLSAFFLGHPFVDPRFQLQVEYDPDGPILLLPGSRSAAVGRIFPRMLAGMAGSLDLLGDKKVRVLYPGERIRGELERILSEVTLPFEPELRLVSDGSTGSAVVTSSGTMSLQCALAGIPGTIVYRAHPMTYWLGKTFVKIPYLGIANILLKKPFYPELLQGAASPKKLREQVARMLSSGASEVAKEAAATLRNLLSANRYLDPAAWLKSHLDPPEVGEPVTMIGP